MEQASPLVNRSRAVARHVADFLWPPMCLSCRAAVTEPRSLCAECWSEVRFLEAPLCRQCGFPFEFETDDDLCAACMADPPRFDAARAVMVYGDVPKKLIGAMKYGDRQEGAPAFAAWLHRAGRELISECDVILPVPLHRRKLFQRRFNQSAMLGQMLAKRCGLPFLADGLTRVRYTENQAGLGHNARLKNVKGAFRVSEGRYRDIEGRSVLLIDDVYTTGATADACAQALRRGGAAWIGVLTLARVVQARRT